MCGVVAIVDTMGSTPLDRIEAMRAAIAHRGPDHGGMLLRRLPWGVVGLGAQRLSILDLSPLGAMPMCNEDETVWLVYNGEIYNHEEVRADLERRGHRYRSRTDTETVIHAYEEYGPNCFARFNGMFACIILDERRGQIVVARDRTGIKPLYYAEGGGRLLCASELKALTSTGLIAPEIDATSLDRYLGLGYVPAPYSLIRGVQKLPAGTYGLFEDGQLRLTRYWRPAATGQTMARSWHETVAATRAAVAGAVRRQLMSDVPVGVMLSGGLDSTIVAAVANGAATAPLHTFSIGFATGHSALEPIYNHDREYAARVAATLGTMHHEIVATDSDVLGLEGQLRHLAAALDEPVWEPSFLSIYLISTLAREHGVKVLLSGDGSDELFGGYPWHPALRRLDALERVPGLGGPLALAARAPLPASVGARARDLARKYRRGDLATYHLQYDIFDSPERARLLGRVPTDDPLDDLLVPLLGAIGSGSRATRFALAEFVLWVGEHFNQRLDRMAMAASVEGRVPFQDNEVIDLALALPIGEKLRGGESKAPLRAAFADLVPDFVAGRPKRPFAAPATAWMQGALRPLILAALAPGGGAELAGLDPAALAPIRERYRTGLPVRQEQIWAMLNLALWAEGLRRPAQSATNPEAATAALPRR